MSTPQKYDFADMYRKENRSRNKNSQAMDK
jgi:hypothetical protein